MGDSFCSGFVAWLLFWENNRKCPESTRHALSWANGQVSTWGCDTVQGALISDQKVSLKLSLRGLSCKENIAWLLLCLKHLSSSLTHTHTHKHTDTQTTYLVNFLTKGKFYTSMYLVFAKQLLTLFLHIKSDYYFILKSFRLTESMESNITKTLKHYSEIMHVNHAFLFASDF